MKWIAKLATAAQAVLLAQLGVARPADAAAPPQFTEAAGWQAAISSGTPEALQQFISHFPRGERTSEAFELIVVSEIATAQSLSKATAAATQLAEARRQDLEMLEHDFDLGTGKKESSPAEDSERLGPY